jgi:hypothetical protein
MLALFASACRMMKEILEHKKGGLAGEVYWRP